MNTLSCPSCGAAVPFKSRVAIYAVCNYCESTVVKKGIRLELIGKEGAVPTDLTPLMIGTGGKLTGRTFEVIGRVRWGWESGFWNEWFCQFEGDNNLWLSEAYGQFAFYPEVLPVESLAKENLLITLNLSNPGESVVLNKNRYRVVDIKSAHVYGYEGELPYRFVKGQQRCSLDLVSERYLGQCATIEIENKDNNDGGIMKVTSIYIGQYWSLQALALKNLRAVPGWETEKP